MHPYELMEILDPGIDERTVAPSMDKFLGVIRNAGGEIENVDIWGKRRLAYEINKQSEGIYVVVNFTASPEATAELDRQLGLSEAVLRTKVLRADELIAQRAAQAKRDRAKAARAAHANPNAATRNANAAPPAAAARANDSSPTQAPRAAASRSPFRAPAPVVAADNGVSTPAAVTNTVPAAAPAVVADIPAPLAARTADTSSTADEQE